MVLEFKDVQKFKAVEKQDKSQLQISGLAFHSALAVERISVETQGQDLIVELHLVRARVGLSGSFDYTVDVPVDTVRVLFGKERKEIWRRP